MLHFHLRFCSFFFSAFSSRADRDCDLVNTQNPDTLCEALLVVLGMKTYCTKDLDKSSGVTTLSFEEITEKGRYTASRGGG